MATPDGGHFSMVSLVWTWVWTPMIWKLWHAESDIYVCMLELVDGHSSSFTHYPLMQLLHQLCDLNVIFEYQNMIG